MLLPLESFYSVRITGKWELKFYLSANDQIIDSVALMLISSGKFICRIYIYGFQQLIITFIILYSTKKERISKFFNRF